LQSVWPRWRTGARERVRDGSTRKSRQPQKGRRRNGAVGCATVTATRTVMREIPAGGGLPHGCYAKLSQAAAHRTQRGSEAAARTKGKQAERAGRGRRVQLTSGASWPGAAGLQRPKGCRRWWTTFWERGGRMVCRGGR
jgi:hypothetical protein